MAVDTHKVAYTFDELLDKCQVGHNCAYANRFRPRKPDQSCKGQRNLVIGDHKAECKVHFSRSYSQ